MFALSSKSECIHEAIKEHPWDLNDGSFERLCTTTSLEQHITSRPTPDKKQISIV